MSANALYAIGHHLLSRGSHAQAADVFRAMARIAPSDERSWLGLGACHEAADQHEVAVQMYGVGEELASPSPRCALARARALCTLDRDRASDAFTTAAKVAERASDFEIARLIAQELSQWIP